MKSNASLISKMIPAAIVFLFFLFCKTTTAVTTVPGDYSTIKAAIDKVMGLMN